MATISIEIETGNDAMQTPADVADAIRAACDAIEDANDSRAPIRDYNGNTVGFWEMVGEWEEAEEPDPDDLWAAVGEET
jgi:hypothetical protein